MMKCIVPCVCAFVFLFGCSDRDESPGPGAKEVMFNVDSTRIQSAYQPDDYGFSLHPPEGWDRISGDLLENVRQSLQPYLDVADTFHIRPLQFFLHPDRRSLLVVSHISASDTSAASPELIDRYTEAVRTAFALNNIKEDRYTKTGISIIQYLLQKDDNVIFKILFTDSKERLIQLDYVVPRTAYPEESRAIESSIGTLGIQ